MTKLKEIKEKATDTRFIDLSPQYNKRPQDSEETKFSLQAPPPVSTSACDLRVPRNLAKQ